MAMAAAARAAAEAERLSPTSAAALQAARAIVAPDAVTPARPPVGTEAHAVAPESPAATRLRRHHPSGAASDDYSGDRTEQRTASRM